MGKITMNGGEYNRENLLKKDKDYLVDQCLGLKRRVEILEQSLETGQVEPLVISCNKKEELRVTEALLAERERVLKAIPECPVHGECVPHAIEWIEKAKKEEDVKEGYVVIGKSGVKKIDEEETFKSKNTRKPPLCNCGHGSPRPGTVFRTRARAAGAIRRTEKAAKEHGQENNPYWKCWYIQKVRFEP